MHTCHIHRASRHHISHCSAPFCERAAVALTALIVFTQLRCAVCAVCAVHRLDVRASYLSNNTYVSVFFNGSALISFSTDRIPKLQSNNLPMALLNNLTLPHLMTSYSRALRARMRASFSALQHWTTCTTSTSSNGHFSAPIITHTFATYNSSSRRFRTRPRLKYHFTFTRNISSACTHDLMSLLSYIRRRLRLPTPRFYLTFYNSDTMTALRCSASGYPHPLLALSWWFNDKPIRRPQPRQNIAAYPDDTFTLTTILTVPRTKNLARYACRIRELNGTVRTLRLLRLSRTGNVMLHFQYAALGCTFLLIFIIIVLSVRKTSLLARPVFPTGK